MPERRSSLVLALAGLVALRLWLVTAQRLSAMCSTPYDDELFVRLARSLASGQWLGVYDRLTLTKGPFYPMWIAASYAAGVPLLMGEHLLYAVACAVLVWGIAPALPGRKVQGALFAVLLFSPASYAARVMSRVDREGIYPALTLLVLGTAAGALLRLQRARRVRVPWALASGLSLAAFWLCREERVWIAPGLACLVGGLVWAWRPIEWRRLASASAISLAVFVVLVACVRARNLARYGVFVVTEFTEGPFQEGYAALARVRHAAFRPRVSLPAETRARIYAASPAFAELRPFLEGGTGQRWVRVSCRRAPAGCEEIGAHLTTWALRDAAAVAGHGKAPAAAAYWHEVAREVNAACDGGVLACAASSTGYLPQLRREYLPRLATSLGRAVVATTTFEGVSPRPHPSRGGAMLDQFRTLTRTPLEPPAVGSDDANPGPTRSDALKLRVLESLVAGYRRLTALLAALALLGFAVGVGRAVRRAGPTALLVITGTLLVGALTRLVLIALIDATTFDAVTPDYLAPAYPLMLAGIVLAFPAAVQATEGPLPGRL